MTKTILFDINETVLDLKSLQSSFELMFGNRISLGLWFAKLLHSSNITTITGLKTNFGQLADITLEGLAVQHNLTNYSEQKQNFLAGFKSLRPHADIIPALQKLKDNQYTTIAFSNSSNQLLQDQIENAGLKPYFDDIISVESSGFFKPHQEAYLHACTTLNQPPEQLRLIAAHDWDTHGAMSAGLKAAYLNRSNAPYHPLYNQPEIKGNNMGEVVEKIIATNKPNL